jgi:peptide/nickel transport system substrate-binding protein
MIHDALGKIGAFFAIIVPEHPAQIEPTKGMPEFIGSGPKAMFGWPDSPRLEELRWQWPDGPDVAEQQRICREIQAFQDVPYYRSACSIRQLPTA